MVEMVALRCKSKRPFDSSPLCIVCHSSIWDGILFSIHFGLDSFQFVGFMGFQSIARSTGVSFFVSICTKTTFLATMGKFHAALYTRSTLAFETPNISFAHGRIAPRERHTTRRDYNIASERTKMDGRRFRKTAVPHGLLGIHRGVQHGGTCHLRARWTRRCGWIDCHAGEHAESSGTNQENIASALGCHSCLLSLLWTARCVDRWMHRWNGGGQMHGTTFLYLQTIYANLWPCARSNLVRISWYYRIQQGTNQKGCISSVGLLDLCLSLQRLFYNVARFHKVEKYK
mmetsp:Transcript_24489/g.37755  ORF Transcript_24489/g.37755 Transcript_24489/m.37755 type:complete len:287 (+) Transcript_24489:389-1249(+)